MQLILVGSKRVVLKTFEEVRKLQMEEGQMVGLCSVLIYRICINSEALVMPSLFESVSLPIWEAFYLRTLLSLQMYAHYLNKLLVQGCF
jgi:hypothetical protein